MNWKRILIASLCFVVYMALVIWLGFALSFADSQLALFCALLGLLGLAAVLTTLWYLNKLDRSRNELENFSSPDSVNLHALLRDANQRIRSAGRGGIKSISDLPLLYVLGDENSAKTLTVLKSGLNPELLAGAVNQDASVMPTQLVNLWLSGNWVIGEAGGSMLRQPTLFNQFAKSTIPARLGSAFASDSRLPARLALVCVSIERILAPNTAEQIRALAQQLNERLRHLSQTLGVALPVYVLFTKLDTVSPFTDYAVRLTEEEVMQPVGSLLPSSNAHAGYYAEEATAAVSQQFDSMIFALSEYRLEVLSREGQLAELAHAYEFPRDLRKLRKGIVSFLVEVARPSQIGVNPFLRGFFFSGVRPHFVQSILDVGPAMPAQQASMDDPDATRAFTFQSTPHRPAPARAPQGPSSRKEAQWVFLPQLMSRIVLADKLAQEASRSSTRTHMLRRILLGSAIAATTMLLFLATVSYFNNHKLVRRVTETASGPVLTPSGGSLAAQSDLERLETLRQQVELLEKYRTDGPPTLYRMGLYHGNALLPYACQAYADRFRALLLAPTQTGIVNRLSSLPLTPTKDDSYVATYRPLKAYLITATNPNPDTPQDTTEFLPEALLTAWNSNNAADAETSRLAMLQFAFYARHLAAPDSCMATVGGGAKSGCGGSCARLSRRIRGLPAHLPEHDCGRQPHFGIVHLQPEVPRIGAVYYRRLHHSGSLYEGWLHLHAERHPASGRLLWRRAVGVGRYLAGAN